ncbi:recombinase family protein [Listeria booriae]|uniref:recombinase family protein n=1 Tax=Listeria booriae TaxID=1552123 RepID=UPI0016299F54|nr:recombinase family protein [Listeria booriae]MBC2080291.1 recombinase family protein [Listeria booriae]
MKQQQSKIPAVIYLRLSRDDVLKSGESISISSQRQILHRYAEDNGFTIAKEYVDDGYSGTNFNRPGFKSMKADIEAGKITTVLTKDLSRLGRNYLETGYFTEIFFEEHNVRFIAIHDGVDTLRTENEFMPFRNVMNEMYAKDGAKKVRAGYRVKAQDGKFTGAYAPYGYLKDPDNKYHLIIDKEVAHVVRKIFNLAAAGDSAFKIAKTLTTERILKPRAYLAKKTGKYMKSFDKHPYDWGCTTVRTIIKNEAYIGHMVGNKMTTRSFKDKRLVYRPKDDWIRVENTHEPLVDEYTFEQANKLTAVKKVEDKKYPEDPNIYSGILKCSTCGKGLSLARQTSVKYTSGNYMCNKSRQKGKEYCSMHYISRKNLNRIVLEDIQHHIREAHIDERKLIVNLSKHNHAKQLDDTANYEEIRNKKQNREQELEIIIDKLYEDYALGKISESKYESMTEKYNEEYETVVQELDHLNKKISENSDDEDKNKRFVKLLKNYTEVTELSANLLNNLIDKIVIYDSELIGDQRAQRVDIHYKFAGLIKSSDPYTSL